MSEWERFAVRRKLDVELTVIDSPFREVTRPLLRFLDELPPLLGAGVEGDEIVTGDADPAINPAFVVGRQARQVHFGGIHQPEIIRLPGYAENEEPQPQVDVAFGFLITNCAPSTLS